VSAAPIGVSVLGSTGSIGAATLDVCARHPDRFRVVALAAARSADRLFDQIVAHRPALAVLADPQGVAALAARVRAAGLATEVRGGTDALLEVATHPQARAVMAAIVGGAGLVPTLAAARAGKRVLLANKEALVMAGALFMAEVRAGSAELLPIDSEHNALFQCMPAGFVPGATPAGVRRVLLTASGGPLRELPLERLAEVTPEQACAHPNWSMGRKISVDSATMMNKGLEVVEAHWLFALPPERIEVVVHPQSIVHSLVEYEDGSMLAQLGNPDMRTPIAYALAWPGRAAAGVAPLDLVARGRLDFAATDLRRFPCLALAYQALRAGAAAPAVLNAANEVAVAEFLARRLRFDGIAPLIEDALARFAGAAAGSLEALLALDGEVRAHALARSRVVARTEGAA
jgi:1-deoxy-D-xylulose-5-phosphate reductoisomerase